MERSTIFQWVPGVLLSLARFGGWHHPNLGVHPEAAAQSLHPQGPRVAGSAFPAIFSAAAHGLVVDYRIIEADLGLLYYLYG